MTKLNPLPPTLRDIYRYIVFEMITENDVEFELGDVVNAIWHACLEFYGEAGTASFALWIPADLYLKDKHKGVVRCTHKYVEEVRLALASITHIRGKKVVFKVLGVTGTILSAKKKYLGLVNLQDY
jgi:ribonuclease P/MRP protein subunit POP5